MRSADSGETWGKSRSHPLPASLHTPGRQRRMVAEKGRSRTVEEEENGGG